MRWVEVLLACMGAAAIVATFQVEKTWGTGPAYGLVALGASCCLGVGLLRVRRA